MARSTVKVEGLRELEKALKELPRATAANVMKRVLVQAGTPVADHAESLAPVRTGKLQKAIGIGGKLTRRQKATSPKQSKVEVYIGVGRSLPQGVFQEFGTVKNGPQPFMRPAWDGGKMEVLAKIKALTWAEIEKAAARLARKNARAAAKAAAAG
jgi:HK97 gp10 family phage protein